MSDLVAKLGIDWKLLLAQIVNFLVLLWVLKRFAYGPIMRALDNRSKRIEQSLAHATAIEAERTKLEEGKQAELQQARVEAQALLGQARQDAEAFLAQAREQAKMEAAGVVKSASQEARRMKNEIVAEAKQELADVVAASAEKVIRVKLDASADRKLIDEALREMT
ncbi:MAG: F0F1 ATP synthase subunit B [Candidatus Kerfeldbacteria bacterium]|nr:F0F1 ATP synthase subunit B [Candidatus Kerfeldbacteria bacterium]